MNRLLVMIILFLASVYIYAQNPTAVIMEMSGTVELKRSGTSNWVQAKIGDTLDKSTVISTGFKSTAVLSLGNSTLTVRALTRLSLEELINVGETETINISLNTGRVRVDVSPPAGGRASFTVQSPVATASVRGTSFDMDIDSIQVITGAVSYIPVSSTVIRPVTVSAGQESWVDSGTGAAVAPSLAADIKQTMPVLAGDAATTVSSNSGVSSSGTSSSSAPPLPGSLETGVHIGGEITIGIIVE